MTRGLSLLALLFATACRQNDDAAGADELLQQVEDDDYQGWARAPGYAERTPSDAPHSDNVEIFVNEIVQATLDEGDASEWPTGSIIIKDGYTDDGELALIAVMEKRETGWFWAEYDADGTALYSGSPTICTDCHEPGADFVRAFGF